jgi:hypothetical protein
MIPELLLAGLVFVSPVSMEQEQAHSTDAQDWRGHEKSLYQGEHYSSKWAVVRKCIMHRESRHNYRARSSISTASGAYQFLDSQWRVSLTYMMVQESRVTADGLINEIRALRHKPIQEWNRYFQDRAWYTAWDNGSGADHWNLTRHGC